MDCTTTAAGALASSVPRGIAQRSDDSLISFELHAWRTYRVTLPNSQGSKVHQFCYGGVSR